MRIRLLAAVALAFVVGGIAQAQPARAAEPTLEVRLRSVNDLLDKALYVGKLAGKEDVVQGVKHLLKNLSAEGKGIEGIDPKRPFGIYATLDKDVVNSPFIVMVPIADKDRFLLMLKERLEIVPEKTDGGALKIKLPEQAQNPVIDAVYLQFADGYLYVGRSAKDVDAKTIISPKAFFAKDDGAVASVLVRMDRIPAEVKTFVTGQLELAMAEQRKKTGNDPVEKAVFEWLSDTFIGGTKSLLDDAKDVTARVFVDEKSDEFVLEATLTPKSGTPMAKYISSLSGKSSLAAGIVSNKDAVARGSVKLAMPEEMKKRFGGVVDTTIADILKKIDNNQEREMAKRVFDTLAPSLKAAELDAALAMIGPDARGRHTLLGAAAVKNGKDVEKLLKEFAPLIGEAATCTFDVVKVGDFTLHKVAFNDFPPEVEKIFGTKTLWLALSDTHAAFSLEADGEALKAALKAKAATVPVFTVEVSAAKVLPLVAQNMKPEEVKALLKETFGEGAPAGKDTITVVVTGGESLTLRAKMKGKVVSLLFGSGLFGKD